MPDVDASSRCPCECGQRQTGLELLSYTRERERDRFADAELRYCYSSAATALHLAWLAHPAQIQPDQSPDQMQTAAKDGDPAVARHLVYHTT